jgi:hypothetical protein
MQFNDSRGESLTAGIEWLQPFYAQKKLENDEYLFSREGMGFQRARPLVGSGAKPR